MKALRLMLLALGIGGGALWIGVRDSSAAAKQCGRCAALTCTRGGGESTCKSGIDGDRRWCVESSGCASH